MFKTSKTIPYGVWFLTILTALISVKLILLNHFTTSIGFSLAAGVLIFFKNKVTWTVAASWLVVAFLTSIIYVDGVYTELRPDELIIFGIYLLNTLLQLVFLGYYFKYPYLNSRGTMVSSGDRLAVALSGQFVTSQKSIPITVLNISSSGAAVKIPPSVKLQDLEKPFIFEIPEIKSFKMRVRIVRMDADIAALQFLGWSLKSVVEHLKIIAWLKSQTVKASAVSSSAGFTLMEAMIVCGIGAILVFTVSGMFADVTNISQSSKALTQIQLLRDNFARTMRNTQAWQNTIADTGNTTLDCIRNNELCDADLVGLITLRDHRNQAILQSRIRTNGYNLAGNPCTTFDIVNGNDTCPLQFTVRARSTCTGACRNPTIELLLKVDFNPAHNKNKINANKFSTVVYRDPLVDSLLRSCEAMNGTFDGSTGLCNLRLLSGPCGSYGEYLAGVIDGVPQCRNMVASGNCPLGQFLKGFNAATGVPVCATI